MSKRVSRNRGFAAQAVWKHVLCGSAAVVALFLSAHALPAQTDTSRQQQQQTQQQPPSPYDIVVPTPDDNSGAAGNGTQPQTSADASGDSSSSDTAQPSSDNNNGSANAPSSGSFDIQTDAQGYPISNGNYNNQGQTNSNQGQPNNNQGQPNNNQNDNGTYNINQPSSQYNNQPNGNQPNGQNGTQSGSQNNGQPGSQNGNALNRIQPNGNPQNPNQPNGQNGAQNGVRPNGQGTQRQPNRPQNGLNYNQQNPNERYSDDTQQIHVGSPYHNLPSLEDLYTQIPSRSVKPLRFGSTAFRFGTGNASDLPADLPAGPDYVLGPGDSIQVSMWGGRSERLNLIVDRQGQIALPEVGTLTLNGLTIAQAQAEVQRALNTQFQHEQAAVSLGRVRTVRVYVVGDVQAPGGYDVSSLSTALNALYLAGGPTSRGSLRVLKQMRGDKMVAQIDLYDFLLKGVRTNIERLEPGDTILVPPVGPQVTVEGAVRRPAIYELNGETSLAQVLDLAGGVLPSASMQQISVERVIEHQRHVMLNLQLSGDSSAAAKQALSSFSMQADDDVIVSQILPYNQQAVYLQGHVFRPGRYPYREGMTISDLLHSYKDVLPEPADRGEIIRLEAPDFRPESISFNVPDALIGNSPILLQPFDVVRVFSRYEADPPRVRIEGEVLRPGRYPMSEGMTVADLVRLAGGFSRSAYRDDVDLSSYTVQGASQVLLSHQVVDVQKVMNGDKNADAALKPGDVVSVRQLAGWTDIGSLVTINGEVAHPGSFGLAQGERLSSVLKRAGGFTINAYPEAAVMTRVQVQLLAEQARQAMVDRLEATPISVKSGPLSATSDTLAVQQSLQQQRDQAVAILRSHPASGRMVINISGDISQWENTPADIEMRAGDTIIIPKRPNFVMVTGQTYNATGISYIPGKRLKWYLDQAGGVTTAGDKKKIYVLRANGSVVAQSSGWHENILNVRLQPGDTIVVPEKLVGGSEALKNLIAAAQIASSIAITGAVAGIF